MYIHISSFPCHKYPGYVTGPLAAPGNLLPAAMSKLNSGTLGLKNSYTFVSSACMQHHANQTLYTIIHCFLTQLTGKHCSSSCLCLQADCDVLRLLHHQVFLMLYFRNVGKSDITTLILLVNDLHSILSGSKLQAELALHH